MAQAVFARARYSETFFVGELQMLCNKKTKRNLAILLMAAVVAAGAGVATAEARYHLVLIPDISYPGEISDSGVILAGSILVEPARDAADNPVWDSDGDGIVDGHTVTTLEPGAYQKTRGASINEFLDVVGSGKDENGKPVGLLWLNAPDGSPPVELGQTFNADEVHALSINDLGQVVVFEFAYDFSDPDVSNWTETWALSLVNPKDTDADGAPDLWFEDADGDGNNDLMVNLAFATTGLCCCQNCYRSSINNHGEIVGYWNPTQRGFVIVPIDTDGDGEPDLWFEDLDGDGWNDLARVLDPTIEHIALSDSGVVVGTEIVWGKDDHFLRWQIDESGNVALVAEERGACFMKGVNNLGQALGVFHKSMPRDMIKFTTILWEPDLTIINLLDLLDNPPSKSACLRGTDISNTGYIVGSVLDNYPQEGVGFIAVPIAQSPPGPGPGPSVDSITPDTMPAGTSIDVTISGSGFVAGAEVSFENGSGPSLRANVTSVDGTTIEATVTAHRKAKLGVPWDVRVTNPDGSSDALVDGFTVTP